MILRNYNVMSNDLKSILDIEYKMTQRCTAVVKWFNKKAGYGFLTYVGENQTPEDIFVHHSEIKVSTDQYKYLVQGEYVEFVLSPSDGEHKCLATSVCGVTGGKLMCETRSDSQSARPTTEFSPRGGQTRGGHVRGGQTRGGHMRGGSHVRDGYVRDGQTRDESSSFPPSLSEQSQGEWMLVRRKQNPSHSTRGSGRGRRPGTELS